VGRPKSGRLHAGNVHAIRQFGTSLQIHSKLSRTPRVASGARRGSAPAKSKDPRSHRARAACPRGRAAHQAILQGHEPGNGVLPVSS